MVLPAIGINLFNKQSCVCTYVRKTLVVRETTPNMTPCELFNFLFTAVFNAQKTHASVHQGLFLPPSMFIQSEPRSSNLNSRIFTQHFAKIFDTYLGDSTFPSNLKKFSHEGLDFASSLFIHDAFIR